MPESVGLIGLGLVGTALAARLQAAGKTVVGYDIDALRQPPGVQLAESPAAVAEQARTIILSLPDSEAVEAVAEQLAGPRFVIDTTTGDPERTVALAAAVEPRGLTWFDVALVGSSTQIRSGLGTMLIGGDPAAFERVRGALVPLGAWMFHLGPTGSGQRAKLAINLVLGLQRLALAEGLHLAERAGLERSTLLEVLKATPAWSKAMDAKGTKMVRDDYTPEARLRQHLKDVELMLALGERTGADLPTTALHRELLSQAVSLGLGELDNSAILKVLGQRGEHDA